MATTSKKSIEFTAKNVKAFTGWLKRFSAIDNTLLLEIDQMKSTFVAKTYNEERSVVKMSTIKFDEAGLTTKVNKDPKRIKVGIFNISRLIKIMDQFNDDEFNITIEYQDLVGDSDTQYAGEKILLKNKTLHMNVDCTSLNIFKYITDDIFNNNIAKAVQLGTFPLSRVTIEKINGLNSLDNEHRFMEFKFVDGTVVVVGKSYDIVIGTQTATNADLSIFKEQYATLDIEGYDVELGDDRLVFRSKDSETVTVISKAEDRD